VAGRSVSPYEQYGVSVPDTDAALRVHTFRDGETITGLADKYLADWRLWRLIADRNALEDVRQIPVGKRLLIPDRPLEKGKYEIN
jgi:hypothetical protein